MKKLELNLTPYLPYGLKGIDKSNNYYYLYCVDTRMNPPYFWMNGNFHKFSSAEIKPILRPWTDLTKEIEHDGVIFMPFNFLSERPRKEIDILGFPNVNDISAYEYQKLLEWHFDVEGLIEKGLAVDVNSLS